MEDKAIRQEINTNIFVNSMEHPKNEEIKNELDSAFKSNFIPEEIKEIIKTKFYDNIINNKKEYGEEYDRYLVNLLSKKRKDYKYLQAIFLIINNPQKLELLRKEGICYDKEDDKQDEISDIPFDDDENWFIEIQIDLVFNDNHYYHKYVKKIINELFVMVDMKLLLKYIKIEFIKKGELYYKNNSEEFLSSIISLFEYLHNLTKVIDENKPKRKKKNKKKNKNKNVNADDKNKNTDNDNNDIYNPDINLDKKDEDNIINDNNNKVLNKINNNEITDIKEDNSNNNNKLDNQNKNIIWLNNLELNREELELGNNKYDKPLKNEEKKLNYPIEIESTETEIGKKFMELEKQINELKSKNEIQANQISQCQEDISKLRKENEQLKKTQKITNIYIYKKLSNILLKKIVNKYNDKLKIEKKDNNIIINFIEDINEIKVNDLNKFVSTITNLNKSNYGYKSLNEIFCNEDKDMKLDQNIIEKLFTKKEMESLYLFEDDIEIQNLIKEELNKK